MDHPALEVEAGHLGQLHLHVLLLAHDVPEGGSDLARGQHAGRRLVEEGLEQMVIAPVDQRDVDRFASQQPGGRQAAEPTPDDDHPVRAGTSPGAGHRAAQALDSGEPSREKRVHSSATATFTSPGCSA